MRALAFWVACVCTSCLVACDAEFAPGSRIEGPRLLAVRADAPFARPEQRVSFEPLLAAPTGEHVAWAFTTCTDPRASSTEACLAALDGPFRPFDPTLTGLSLQLSAADAYARTGLFGVVIAACPGTIVEGVTQRIPIVCRGSDGEALGLERFELGVKRIFVRERDRNDNPSIVALTWDGEPWPADEVKLAEACDEKTDKIADCPKGLRHKLGISTSTPERGTDEQGVAFEEQQVVQVYATQGVFEYEVRIASDADNSWVAQRGPDADSDLATLWFVVRDDRGGVAWERRQVRVR